MRFTAIAAALKTGVVPAPESDTIIATLDNGYRGAGIVLSEDLLTVSNTAPSNYQTVFGTQALKGNRYWEVYIASAGTQIGVGVSAKGLVLDSTTDWVGSNTTSAGLWLNNYGIYTNSVRTITYNVAAPVNLKFAFNSTTRKLWVGVVGGEWIGGGDPVAGTLPTATFLAGVYYPTLTLQGSGNSTVNFGNAVFLGPVPAGYEPGIFSTSDDIPPTPVPETDPYKDYIEVLLNYIGADGSSVFIDDNGHLVTAFGNAHISTDQDFYGESVGAFDGDGDYLTVDGLASLIAGTQFTLETFAWIPETSVIPSGNADFYNSPVIGQTNAVGNGEQFLGISYDKRLMFDLRNGTPNRYYTSVEIIPSEQWVHLEWNFASDKICGFINGIKVIHINTTLKWSDNGNPFYLFRQHNGSYPQYKGFFNGYVKGTCFTIGIARHTEDFTPPTLPRSITPVAYSYYRLLITAAQVFTPISIGQISFFNDSSIAPISVIASSEDSAFPSSNLIDGDSNSKYVAGASGGQWLLFSFIEGTTIDSMQIVPPITGSIDGVPKDFELQKSVDGAWVSVISCSGQTDWSNGVSRSYNTTQGTYEPDPVEPEPEPDPVPATPYPTRTRGTAETSVTFFGAVGNGVKDDTVAINTAIQSLPADGGTVFIPAGTYLVDATKVIDLRSNMLLDFEDGARLVCKANNQERYNILRAKNCNNVEIANPVIVGDRDSHLGTTGEWGYGIRVEQSTAVTIRGGNISKCWGDGIILIGSDLWLWEVTSDNNRRQAVTVGLAHDVRIERCTLTNTNGTAPQAGIDIEPDTGPSYNIVIKDCVITGNSGAGVLCWQHNGYNITITGCNIQNNHWGVYTDSVSDIEVSNCIVKGQSRTGIRIDKKTNNILVVGCTLGENYGKPARSVEVDITGYSKSIEADILVSASATNVSVGTNHYE